jgi:hypothetical protein
MEALVDPSSAREITEEQFQEETGYVLFSIFSLSDLKQETADDPLSNLDAILANVDNDLERKAQKFGSSWYLDDEVQQLFAYGAITGESITPYLEDLSWWKNTTEDERDWIKLVYRDPNKANEIIKDNYQSLLLSLNQLQITGEGADDLIKQLTSDLSSGKFGTGSEASSEINSIVSLLVDSVKRQQSGGLEALPEDYQGYVGRINETKSGEGTAFDLVEKYLGTEAAHSYRESGLLKEYSGLLRADSEAGTTINADMINEELQKAHDKLYPEFEGSKHQSWSTTLYEDTRAILGKTSLSRGDKKKVDLISQSVGGDRTLIRGAIRKEFEDDPSYQNTVLQNVSRVFGQDQSGVFYASGMR